MFRQRLLTAGVAGLVGVLVFAEVSRAQHTEPSGSQGVTPGFTAGSPYSFRPLLPYWSRYAPPPPVPRYERLGAEPVFMTSLQYPGIYGAYTFGVTPISYYDQSPMSTLDAVPGGPTTLRATRGTTLSNPDLYTALINVRVPTGDAELKFDNQRLTPTGTLREFVTPPLVSGANYVYNVKATWVEDGVQRTRDKNVYVRAGDRLEVDLTTGRGTYEGPSMRVVPRLPQSEDKSTLQTRPDTRLPAPR